MGVNKAPVVLTAQHLEALVVEVEGVGRLVNRIVSEAEFFRARAQEHAE